MELVNLIPDVPMDQPRLRVYETYVVLNSHAMNLLGLKEGDYVKFACPRFSSSDRKHIYVGKANSVSGAFSFCKRSRCARINHIGLARTLLQALDGVGCYRVCPEDKVTDNGEVYYNVFFKKYDKENTD